MQSLLKRASALGLKPRDVYCLLEGLGPPTAKDTEYMCLYTKGEHTFELRFEDESSYDAEGNFTSLFLTAVYIGSANIIDYISMAFHSELTEHGYNQRGIKP